jgi:hypothetical protein
MLRMSWWCESSGCARRHHFLAEAAIVARHARGDAPLEDVLDKVVAAPRLPLLQDTVGRVSGFRELKPAPSLFRFRPLLCVWRRRAGLDFRGRNGISSRFACTNSLALLVARGAALLRATLSWATSFARCRLCSRSPCSGRSFDSGRNGGTVAKLTVKAVIRIVHVGLVNRTRKHLPWP